MFTCEFCETFKNTFFTEHLWTTASVFWTCPDISQFHISRITWGIIWQLIIVEAVNNALTSYISLSNYVKLNSNEPIKVAHLQINQCWIAYLW